MLNINLAEKLNLESLPSEKQKEILAQVGSIIHSRITLRIMEELSDQEKIEFDKLLDNSDPESDQVLEFLKNKISNLEQIAEEEVNAFLKEADGIIGAATGQ